MIRAIRPNAMAQDDASLISGWNVAPNLAYTLILLPGSASCGVLLYDESGSTLVATGAALTGTAQPCVLLPQTGQTVGMVDADLGWHLLVTTTGTESQRTIRIGPAVDLPDEIHPVYSDDAMAFARATAAIDAAAHYIDDVTVTCPLGLGAGLGDVVSVPVDGVAVVGQVESITWTATPDGTSEQAVIRRHVAIAPEPFAEPSPPPVVVDDAAETDAATPANGNVLANDDTGLTVVAINGLSANVGQSVPGSTGGVFVIGPDGSWLFDPAEDFAELGQGETVGTSVTYHASDGHAESMATLTVTVTGVESEPVLWTPAEITTAAWWDVADDDTRVLDGSAITQLADKSGNSRHATMVGTSRPTLVGYAANFDGVDDYMDISVPQASPSHIFEVVDTTDSLSGYRCSMNRLYSGAPYPPALYLSSATGAYRPTMYWGTSDAIIDTQARQDLRVQEYRLAPGVVGLRANGGAEHTASHGQAVVSTWTSISTINTYSQQAKFRLHERIVVNAALDTSTRQKVEGYLAHKWDALLGVTTLADALPSDHPYKSAPPYVE